MSFSPSFDQLVQALTCLPGVGNKTHGVAPFT